MENRILVIIDMINDFVKEGGALYFPEGAVIIPAIKKRLNKYREYGLPVLFLTEWHPEGDKEHDRFLPHGIMDTYGCRIVDELGIRTGFEHQDSLQSIIRKTRFDGFYNTILDRRMNELDFFKEKTIEIVGVCTSICVMETAGSFVDRDWEVEIPANCVADFDLEAHEMALRRMHDIYGIKII